MPPATPAGSNASTPWPFRGSLWNDRISTTVPGRGTARAGHLRPLRSDPIAHHSLVGRQRVHHYGASPGHSSSPGQSSVCLTRTGMEPLAGSVGPAGGGANQPPGRRYELGCHVLFLLGRASGAVHRDRRAVDAHDRSCVRRSDGGDRLHGVEPIHGERKGLHGECGRDRCGLVACDQMVRSARGAGGSQGPPCRPLPDGVGGEQSPHVRPSCTSSGLVRIAGRPSGVVELALLDPSYSSGDSGNLVQFLPTDPRSSGPHHQ